MAKNLIYVPAERLTVTVTHPASPVSGDPVRYGNRTGIALTDENATTGKTEVLFGGFMADVSVAAIDDNGNSTVALGDAIFFVDGDTPHLSKKASGYLWGYADETITSGATDTIHVAHSEGIGSSAVGAGTIGTAALATNGVTAAKLTDTLATGFIPLDIFTARLISTNAIQNTTEGGVPDGNTAPKIERVNGATDKQGRLTYVATGVGEIQFAPFAYPPDLDDAANVEVHFLAAMSDTNDTPVLTVGYFEGVGDTNAGGDTGAVTGTSVAEYSRAIAASDIGAAPMSATITVTPGAHGTDALYIYAAWVEYTRK